MKYNLIFTLSGAILSAICFLRLPALFDGMMIPINSVWRSQCLSGWANACFFFWGGGGSSYYLFEKLMYTHVCLGGLEIYVRGIGVCFLGSGVCLGGLGACVRGVGVRLVDGGICFGDWCIWPWVRFVRARGWDLWRCMAIAGDKPILFP